MLTNGAMTIQRAVVLDSLRGLIFAHQRAGNLFQPGEYAAGYREGYEAALVAIALVIGVDQEIKPLLPQCSIGRTSPGL